MTVPQLKQLRAALTYDEQAVARDLPDFIDLMMATGMRIGETAGLAWNDLDAGTIEVRAAIVRITGQGLTRKTTKTDTGQRTLILPSWCTDMLRTRAAFDHAGFDWVTSHVFRKSVASVMDSAGLSSRAAADQLGHANTSMTTDVYFGRKVLATGAAAVLEVLGT